MRPGYEIVSFFLIKQDSEPYYLLSGWKGSIVPSPLLPDLGEVEHETFLLLLWPSPTGEGSCQLSLDVGMLNWRHFLLHCRLSRGRCPRICSSGSGTVSGTQFCSSLPFCRSWCVVSFSSCWAFCATARSHRSRRQWAAMVERESLDLLSLAFIRGWKFQNPSKLLIIFLVWVSGK